MNEVTCPSCRSIRVFLMEYSNNKYWLEFDEDEGLVVGSKEETLEGSENYIVCEDCGEEFSWAEICDWMECEL